YLELHRLGLAGPDWEERLAVLENIDERARALDENFDDDRCDRAAIALATGASERSAADAMAECYYDSTSFEAARQQARLFLRGTYCPPAIRLLLEVGGLGERRKGLRLARDAQGVGNGKELSANEAWSVIHAFLRARYQIDQRGLEKILQERTYN